jgi:E3 ubiquitin-protein ligase NRDP1
MLGKLKIRCIYSENGCKEILTLDNLEYHQKSCRFDKPICDQCFGLRSVDHNCVKYLLESQQKLIESNKELQKELNSAKDRISSLEKEIESYLRTIQELTIANEDKVEPILRTFFHTF